MEQTSLFSLFVRVKNEGRAIRVVLVSGQELELIIHTMGADWIAGFHHLRREAGVLVRADAIAWIEQCETAQNLALGPDTPSHETRATFALMVANLVTRRSRLVVHGHHQVFRGTLTRSGGDYLGIAATGSAGEKIFPFSFIDWCELP